jgi:hypothetical protein
MEDGEIHCIINIKKYARYTRRDVAMSFAENEKLDESENLDSYVTIEQVCQMIGENSMGMDEEGRHLITDKGRQTLAEQVKTRIYNSGLSKLAAKGLLECAWDEKHNTMVFWSDKKSV